MITATLILTLQLTTAMVMVEAPQTKVEMVAVVSEPIVFEFLPLEANEVKGGIVAGTTLLSNRNTQPTDYPTGFT